MFLIYMVLTVNVSGHETQKICLTYVNRHLVHMDSLLNAKFGDEDVEGSVENTNYFGLTDNRCTSLCKIRNHDAEEKMGRLLLSKYGGVLFTGGKSIRELLGIKKRR
jgi:hypothetical protein